MSRICNARMTAVWNQRICLILIYVCANSNAQCIDVCKTGSAKDFIVPGFSKHQKTLHTEARNAYSI